MWIGYFLAYINSEYLHLSLLSSTDQSGLFPSRTPEIATSIHIVLLVLTFLYVYYNRIWGRPSRERILERPILDLYNHIGFMTAAMACTYYYHESYSSFISPDILYLIQSGNVFTALCCLFMDLPVIGKMILYLVINTFTLILSSPGISSIALLTILLSCAILSQLRYFQYSAGNFWEISFSLFLVVLSLELIWIISKCYRVVSSYQTTFSEVISILSLFKPISIFYYYMSIDLSPLLLQSEYEILISSSNILKSSLVWDLTSVSLFFFSRGLWFTAAFCLCSAATAFIISKPDIVTITVRRPVLKSDDESQGSSSTINRPRRVSYETVNVFEVRHTFSDIQLIWPSRTNKIPSGYCRITWKCVSAWL
ncbi:hypothetical protein F4805DRAFT_273301 [Annulohypoxylon moriforme]|nr:hypothetical protein F4805DRAFT_273301 [Annulohypoxylon moriforme]